VLSPSSKQSRFNLTAKRAYDAYVAEASKLGDWYAETMRNASKPFEQTVAKKMA
jgi:hypothetical protein